MWKILKFCFGLVLLAIAIRGDENETLKARLVQMADEKESIYGKFMPLKNGFLGEGGYGVVFKGKMVWGNKARVAMKFIRMELMLEAEREYEMFSYLNAVGNPQIERFGIPNVYYYNVWDGYMMLVLSFFDDGDLVDAHGKGYFNEAAGNRYINSLILFREFVRQSKYLHSKGIRHDDIKPENIMLRKHRSFLIDFNSSSKMLEDHAGGSFDYAPRNFRKEVRAPLADWESFLYTMCRLHAVPLEWFDNPRFNMFKTLKAKLESAGRMKDRIGNTITRIEKSIKSLPLKRVFLKFANETFRPDSPFPDYDGMFDAINAEINDPYACFTWLTSEQIGEARRDLIARTLPDIRRDIADPRQFNFVYETPNFNRFQE